MIDDTHDNNKTGDASYLTEEAEPMDVLVRREMGTEDDFDR